MDFLGKLRKTRESITKNELAICVSKDQKEFNLTHTKGMLGVFPLDIIDECLPDKDFYYLIKINMPLPDNKKRLTVTSLIMDAEEQGETNFKFTFYKDFLDRNGLKLTKIGRKYTLSKQE